MISAELFKKAFPENKHPEEWTEALNLILPKYDITTPERIIAFLAQCGHESCGFTAVKENLNYNAAGLLKTWPRRFNAEQAEEYARQPERIANHAYANRMGNGPEESGDGWRYRGRGVIQLTGKDNYQAFAKAIGKTLELTVAYLETRIGAVESACWYWKLNGLNALADKNEVKAITRIINGGYNGLADRYQRTEQLTALFA
jgi:putative chitinase